MRMELILDPDAGGYEDIRQTLEAEIAALEGVSYSKEMGEPPPKTLSLEHEVIKFIFQHPDLVRLGTALVELVRSAINRTTSNVKKEKPIAVLVVGKNTLKIPSSPQTERRFLESLQQRPTKRKTPRRKPRKSAAKKPKR